MAAVVEVLHTVHLVAQVVGQVAQLPTYLLVHLELQRQLAEMVRKAVVVVMLLLLLVHKLVE
jgi:hypothetical protein